MITDSRIPVRIKCENMSGSDLARVSLFLSFTDEQLHCHWQMVSDGPWDIRLQGAEEPYISRIVAQTYEVTMLGVGAVGDGVEICGRLHQPLNYDIFRKELLAWDVRFSHRCTPPSEARSPVAPVVSSPGPVSPEASPFGIASISANARFRLRRWPPTELIMSHRYHLRLASFLSVRAISQDELARLSNVDPALCESFLQTLRDAGLLTITVVLPSDKPVLPVGGARHPGAAAPGPSAPTETYTGFINKVRKILGLP